MKYDNIHCIAKSYNDETKLAALMHSIMFFFRCFFFFNCLFFPGFPFCLKCASFLAVVHLPFSQFSVSLTEDACKLAMLLKWNVLESLQSEVAAADSLPVSNSRCVAGPFTVHRFPVALTPLFSPPSLFSPPLLSILLPLGTMLIPKVPTSQSM